MLAEQLCRATLPLPYKNPCHRWPTRVSCHTLTKPDYLAPLQNSTPDFPSSQLKNAAVDGFDHVTTLLELTWTLTQRPCWCGEPWPQSWIRACSCMSVYFQVCLFPFHETENILCSVSVSLLSSLCHRE